MPEGDDPTRGIGDALLMQQAALQSSRGQGDDNRTTYWCPSCQA